MRWGNMRGSGNVEDRESAGPAGGFGGGIKLGGVGLIAVLAISWFLGLNPLDVLMSLQGDDTSSAPTQSAPPPSTSAPGARDETKEFIAQRPRRHGGHVERDLQADGGVSTVRRSSCSSGARSTPPAGWPAPPWGPSIARPTAVSTSTDRSSRTCRSDSARRAKFARAYVIAHEVGHHVQNQLGIMDKVLQQRGRTSESRSNALSVLVELQADLLRRRLGPLGQAAEPARPGRRRGGARGGGRHWRRPDSAADAGPCLARVLHPRLLRPARAVVSQRARLRRREPVQHLPVECPPFFCSGGELR